MQMPYVQLDDWDPLTTQGNDQELIIAAKKREINNILKSYTGYYDLFAEMIQNSLDAVERRAYEEKGDYQPTVWITIDMQGDSVSITDNGSGMSRSQFEQFLQPNYSFKDGTKTRGSKGVGATYLAYGFNHLEVATKSDGQIYSGVLKNGREWLEDRTGIIGRPKVVGMSPTHKPFFHINRGTTMTLRLIGNYIRPADLGYNGAKNADQWLNVLRVKTPLGGVYICGDSSSQIRVALQVIHPTTGEASEVELEYPRYLYPHTVFGRTLELKEYLDYQNRRSERHLDVSKIPPKYARRNGIWGEWTAEQILDGDSPISAKSIADAEDRVRELGIKLYIFLGYSTEQWDEYNDTHLGLRKGMRLLRGGLQLATKNMPQGDTITIPMTNNIGFQNIAHVVVHFENAEPDLGRKGFQPEDVEIAERLSVSAVTAFRRYFNQLLRQRTGAPAFQQQILLSEWKAHQRRHEEENPLVIKGRGLFMPTEELPIRSFPLVEQDVVALFNQMLSSGIVRGIQIVSSSQYNQYDGLYRVWMEPPFDKYILSDDNPLGVDSSYFHDISEVVGSLDHLEILEYKFNIDALIEEFRTEEKNPDEVGLLVAWQMGTRWKESFEVISYLDPDNTHLRHAHGLTHCFHHASTGTRTFGAIILYDLVHYLLHPEEEIERQRRIYCEDEDDFL